MSLVPNLIMDRFIYFSEIYMGTSIYESFGFVDKIFLKIFTVFSLIPKFELTLDLLLRQQLM